MTAATAVPGVYCSVQAAVSLVYAVSAAVPVAGSAAVDMAGSEPVPATMVMMVLGTVVAAAVLLSSVW